MSGWAVAKPVNGAGAKRRRRYEAARKEAVSAIMAVLLERPELRLQYYSPDPADWLTSVAIDSFIKVKWFLTGQKQTKGFRSNIDELHTRASRTLGRHFLEDCTVISGVPLAVVLHLGLEGWVKCVGPELTSFADIKISTVDQLPPLTPEVIEACGGVDVTCSQGSDRAKDLAREKWRKRQWDLEGRQLERSRQLWANSIG